MYWILAVENRFFQYSKLLDLIQILIDDEIPACDAFFVILKTVSFDDFCFAYDFVVSAKVLYKEKHVFFKLTTL